MIRKLSLAVAVAAALSPLGAFALGLGEIHTQSALNQRFKADIDLLSVNRDEMDGIRVELGSPEAFTKAGMERPFILSGLKFTPALTPDGRVVISITSQDAVREPFLNFLVEVNWPKGRLMREYTVLLDPPVTLDRQPPRLEAAVVRAAPVRQPQQVQRSKVVPSSGTTAVSSMSGAREYGPINANDNLWNIAKQLKMSGETTEQVMMALQRYNQDAFIRNNVNGLRVGKILRLPENADVSSLSPREARREFLAQTDVWRESRARAEMAPAPSQQPISAPVAAQEPDIAPEDRLELVSAKPDESEEALDQEGKAESGDKVSQLERELMLVREGNESTRQENELLQSRIREMEAQISDIQRLLTLKSDQLTELQTTQQIVAEKTEAIEALQEEALAEEPTVSEMPEIGEIVPIPEGTMIEEVDIESAIEEALQAEQAAQEMAVVEAEKTATPEPPAQEPVIQPPVVSTPTAEPVAQQTPEPTPAVAVTPKRGGFLDILMGNTTLMGIIGAVGILLLSLLWLIMRRRKEVEAEFAESILVTPDGKSAADNAQAGTGSINEPTDETSFMSDFSPSDIDALQDETGEVDPLSEADVYIAYGRYQQAEELIKQALEKFPERDELKDKLLEIYFSAKNKKQFNELAEELHESGMEKEKPDTWSKIAAMGQELSPGNALYAVAAGSAVVALQGAADDDLDDLGLTLDSGLSDEGVITSSETPAEPKSTTDDLGSLDLSDLDNLDELESESLESGLSLDSAFLDSLEASQDPAAENEFESDSLDIDLGELDKASDSFSQTTDDSLKRSSVLDETSEITGLDLPDMDADSGSLDAPGIVGIEDSESLEDLDLESLEKELEMLSGDLETKDTPEEDVKDDFSLPDEVDGLNPDTTDEVTTKLDLARAYVDMGDSEGARSILEEVVGEGDEGQKQQARELLDSMSG